MAEAGLEVTDDTLLAGRVRLRQPRRGHRIGTDAVLLAAIIAVREGEVVYDVGAGAGGVGLIIAARSQASIVFVERDPALVELCRENVALNGLESRARVVQADILAAGSARRHPGLMPGSADVVVTNPPFLDDARARRSPEAGRASAHHMPPAGLAAWLAACAGLLRPKGRLALIHRAERLADCLAGLGHGFGEVTIRPVHARAEEPAIRVLIGAVKGSGAPLRLLPPVVLHDGAGRFTPEAEAVHAGERLLLPNENGRLAAPDLQNREG